MDYYKLSEEPMQAAKVNKEQGLYRMSVSMSTLAIDVLIKSVLHRISPDNDLMMGHNHPGILRVIETKYQKKDSIRQVVKLSRKYFKNSRYSNSEDFPVFTENLAEEFISYAQQVKEYVDIECQATFEDLQKRFGKQNT